MAECQHVWIYERKDHTGLYMLCRRCGAVRVVEPGDGLLNLYRNGAVAKELLIRADGRDGDV